MLCQRAFLVVLTLSLHGFYALAPFLNTPLLVSLLLTNLQALLAFLIFTACVVRRSPQIAFSLSRSLIYFVLSAGKEADQCSSAGRSHRQGRPIVHPVSGQGQSLPRRGEQGLGGGGESQGQWSTTHSSDASISWPPWSGACLPRRPCNPNTSDDPVWKVRYHHLVLQSLPSRIC